MGEGGGITGGFISPGIGIIKSWQGIVEIVLRGVLIVLAFFTMVASGSSQSAVSNDVVVGIGALPRNIDSASGWLIFMGLVLFFYEIVLVVQRFLNINIINAHIKIALIIDTIVHAVLVLGMFAGAIALASYIPDVGPFTRDNMFASTFSRVKSAAEAACVFAFMTIIVTIATAIFVFLGAVIFGWNPTLAKYTSSSGGGGGGE